MAHGEQPRAKWPEVKAAVAARLGRPCKCGALIPPDKKGTRCTACQAIYMKHYRDRKGDGDGQRNQG